MKELLEKVVSIVKEASNLFFDSFDVRTKTNKDDLQTDIDVNVQNRLVGELKELLPDSGFFCEEESLKDTNKDYIWVIDPIDGTNNFVRGLNLSVISVGLLYKNKPVLGVVYNPYSKDLFSAYKNGGAYLNGSLIHTSQEKFETSLFATAMSLYKKELAPLCNEIIMDVYKESGDIRRLGSAALELCYLASGKIDLYFEMRIFPWDYCGALAILKEAGGYFSSLEEVSYDCAQPIIAANNKENFERLYKIVTKHMKEKPYKD